MDTILAVVAAPDASIAQLAVAHERFERVRFFSVERSRISDATLLGREGPRTRDYRVSPLQYSPQKIFE